MIGFNEIPTYWFDQESYTIDYDALAWGQIPDLSLLSGHMNPLSNPLGTIQAGIYFPHLRKTLAIPRHVDWDDITTALEANKPN